MTTPSPATPVRFVDAEQLNAHQLLTYLYEHLLSRGVTPDAGHALTELALAAAVVTWWSRWQPATIHRALWSGAELADIAAATGLDAAEVVRRWTAWAKVQSRLIIDGRPAVDPAQVRTVRRRIGREVQR